MVALGESDLVLECLDFDLPLLVDLVAGPSPGKHLDLVLLPEPEPFDFLLADGVSLDLLLAPGSPSIDLLLICLGDLGLFLPLSGTLDILLAGGEGFLALLALSLDLSLERLLDLDLLLLSLTAALSQPRSWSFLPADC